jgi:hypothetical protein
MARFFDIEKLWGILNVIGVQERSQEVDGNVFLSVFKYMFKRCDAIILG